jgi:hypothetical protein
VIKSHLNALLNKKMDRQNFIKHVAIGAVVLSGAGTALRLIAPKPKPSVGGGYGSSAYGGQEIAKN